MGISMNDIEKAPLPSPGLRSDGIFHEMYSSSHQQHGCSSREDT